MAIVFTGLCAGCLAIALTSSLPSSSSFSPTLTTTTDGGVVDVHIFIMSECSVSASFERTFYPVYFSLFPIVKLTVDYIATPNMSAPLHISSDLGPNDIAGDVWELCAFHTNAANPRNNYEFLLCMSAHQNTSVAIPAIAPTCAKQTLSYAASMVADCADATLDTMDPHALGATLLQTSANTAIQFDASWAPVIWIGGKFWCIWGIDACPFSSSQDIHNAICSVYKGPSQLCSS